MKVKNSKPEESRVQSIVLTDRRTNNGTLEDAIAIAAVVHKGQTDKSGSPYILHPLRLMTRMRSMPAKIVAVLHDVVEDSRNNSSQTKWTFERLQQEGFTEEVITALEGVTDRPGEEYDAFVERAAANPISREVKIADLEDNMNLLRLGEIRRKDLDRIEKYHRSWLRLTSAQRGDLG